MKKFKPYYVVIFTSKQNEKIEGYNEMTYKMRILAQNQDGFISMDSAKNQTRITVSYREILEAIKNWKQQTEYLQTQLKGKQDWYNWFNMKICKVEREYEFSL